MPAITFHHRPRNLHPAFLGMLLLVITPILSPGAETPPAALKTHLEAAQAAEEEPDMHEALKGALDVIQNSNRAVLDEHWEATMAKLERFAPEIDKLRGRQRERPAGRLYDTAAVLIEQNQEAGWEWSMAKLQSDSYALRITGVRSLGNYPERWQEALEQLQEIVDAPLSEDEELARLERNAMGWALFTGTREYALKIDEAFEPWLHYLGNIMEINKNDADNELNAFLIAETLVSTDWIYTHFADQETIDQEQFDLFNNVLLKRSLSLEDNPVFVDSIEQIRATERYFSSRHGGE